MEAECQSRIGVPEEKKLLAGRPKDEVAGRSEIPDTEIRTCATLRAIGNAFQ